mgnify:CR=1 FL=1
MAGGGWLIDSWEKYLAMIICTREKFSHVICAEKKESGHVQGAAYSECHTGKKTIMHPHPWEKKNSFINM